MKRGPLKGLLREKTLAAVQALEAELIPKAVQECGGNLTKAAALLGISHRAMHYKCRRLGITGLPGYRPKINGA
jgi:DNA-binding NtrC family response regulator